MRIEVELPAESARRMGLSPPQGAASWTVTLSEIELAGRLTLATGVPIAPDAVRAYLEKLRNGRAPGFGRPSDGEPQAPPSQPAATRMPFSKGVFE